MLPPSELGITLIQQFARIVHLPSFRRRLGLPNSQQVFAKLGQRQLLLGADALGIRFERAVLGFLAFRIRFDGIVFRVAPRTVRFIALPQRLAPAPGCPDDAGN